MNPKYIIVERGGIFHPFVLVSYERHCDVLPLHGKVIGAGQFEIFMNSDNRIDVSCFGHPQWNGARIETGFEITEQVALPLSPRMDVVLSGVI